MGMGPDDAPPAGYRAACPRQRHRAGPVPDPGPRAGPQPGAVARQDTDPYGAANLMYVGRQGIFFAPVAGDPPDPEMPANRRGGSGVSEDGAPDPEPMSVMGR